MIDMRAVNVIQPDVCYVGGMIRSMQVAEMGHAAGLECTPHCANLSLVTLFTMHLLCAVPNPGKYLEFSIEGEDYYPWQEGLYVKSPFDIVDGIRHKYVYRFIIHEIRPEWLEKAGYQISEME